MKKRGGEAYALRERRPHGQEADPNACFLIGLLTVWFPAVLRPEPRHTENPRVNPSASICVICGQFGWVVGLCVSAPPRLCVEGWAEIIWVNLGDLWAEWVGGRAW